MGVRESERATRETRWRRRWRRPRPAERARIFVPEIAERDGRKEGRKDVVKIYRGRKERKRRRCRRQSKCNMQPAAEGGREGNDIFHRKLSSYRPSWGLGIESSRASRQAAWNKTAGKRKERKKERIENKVEKAVLKLDTGSDPGLEPKRREFVKTGEEKWWRKFKVTQYV